MNVKYWIRHPHLVVARLRYWRYTKKNPTAPWLCPGTIEFLNGWLDRSMTMLEFGSGRSTYWFAERVGKLVSIEHNANWAESIEKSLATGDFGHVDYRRVALDHSEALPEPASFEPMPRYVAVATEFEDNTLDAVLVDGHYRTHCIRAAAPKVRPGGVIVVDDTALWPQGAGPFELLRSWDIADSSTNGIKRTITWMKPQE